MAFVITQPCVGTKDTACVAVCPVDCIHPNREDPEFESAEMLFIDPAACTGCGMCVDECPVRAIFDEPDVPAEWAHFIDKNAAYYAKSIPK